MSSDCFSSLLEAFAEMKKPNQIPQASKLGYDLLEVIVAHGDQLSLRGSRDMLIEFLKTNRTPFSEKLKYLIPN